MLFVVKNIVVALLLTKYKIDSIQNFQKNYICGVR